MKDSKGEEKLIENSLYFSSSMLFALISSCGISTPLALATSLLPSHPISTPICVFDFSVPMIWGEGSGPRCAGDI